MQVPISLFPLSTYMSVALHHLVQWVDAGTVPPRADRMLVDRNVANDGSLMALDEFGNPRGGIRSPYVDVPVTKYGVPNEGAVPATPNTLPWVALRGDAGIDQLCRLTGYEIALSGAELKKLYGTRQRAVTKVQQRVDELSTAGLVVACLQGPDSRRCLGRELLAVVLCWPSGRRGLCASANCSIKDPSICLQFVYPCRHD